MQRPNAINEDGQTQHPDAINEGSSSVVNRDQLLQ